jgi:lipopolysaccharide export system permease protein
MKTIDRYVLWTFVQNWAIAFMVLVGMYMALDMVFNIDDLTSFKADPTAPSGSAWAAVVNIADYYFHHAFLFFNQLAGIIPVVAAAFTLIRLSRFNELTAVLSAGVPLLRVAAPIAIAGLVLNGLVWANQEFVIPNMVDKLNRERDEIHKAGPDEQPIVAMQDDRGSLLYAGRYTSPRPGAAPAVMRDVDVVERDRDGQPLGKIAAAWAVWDAARGGWALQGGYRYTGLAADAGALVKKPADFWATSINPEEIELYRNSEYVEMLSTERINQLLRRPKNYGAADLMSVKHWRFTQPVMNFVLLLLAIPCVLTREPAQLKTAATKCLLYTGLAMGSVFLFHQVAGNPPNANWANQWPALMAWMPIFVFGPVAVFLLDRVKT